MATGRFAYDHMRMAVNSKGQNQLHLPSSPKPVQAR